MWPRPLVPSTHKASNPFPELCPRWGGLGLLSTLLGKSRRPGESVCLCLSLCPGTGWTYKHLGLRRRLSVEKKSLATTQEARSQA